MGRILCLEVAQNGVEFVWRFGDNGGRVVLVYNDN